MKTLSSLALVGALFAAHLPAAIDPAIIGSDARWVVHADFNALRDSAIGKEIIAHVAQAQRGATQGAIGIDIPKVLATIGSATAYGANFSKDPHAIDGTLVLRGTPDLRKILESFLLQGTLANPPFVSEISDLSFPAYVLSDPKQPEKNGLVVAFPPEPIVLASKSKAQLLKAREVLRGSAPSLAKTPDATLRHLFPRGGNEPYLFFASSIPSEELFPADAPQARILKMAQSLSLGVGETDRNTFAHAELVATSEAMADKLMKILQGMTAVLSLAETNDKQLAEFLNSTMVSRNGDRVTLHLAYPSERLVAMAKTLHDKQPKGPAPDSSRPNLVSGKPLAEWTAENVGDAPSAPATRTIENVELQNGATISLGRALNGGRAVQFTQVEIKPSGGGLGLTFTPDMMSRRDNLQQFKFPGATGRYDLVVGYINDGTGKATYAVSVRDAKPANPEASNKAK